MIFFAVFFLLFVVDFVVVVFVRWHENTNFLTNKAFSRIWILRKLKNMGASRRMLIDTYYKHIRTVIEFGAAVWNAGLTQENIAHIERVQKSALHVILGPRQGHMKKHVKSWT